VRRGALSVALLAAGAAMLAVATLASASRSTQGIFRVGIVGASAQVDPQLAYITTAWWLEYATAAKLFNWPDRGSAKLLPEVASRFTVSDRGKRYTFFLRRGFRFSDGTKVTARNFAYAIDRTANKDLASPGAAFITDPNGTNIAGAQEVNMGNATHVSGVRVRGPYKLTIRLTKPDPSFVLKLTMPFFQATSTTLPLTHEVLGGYSSAGPYTYTRNDANVLTSIRRNPYYRRGPGRMRPRHLAGVDIVWGLNEQDAFQQVMANQLDETTPPASEVQNVANQFGVNKTRFWTKPSSCTGFLLLNTREGLLHDNLPMRKAINWAVDRSDYVATAGPYAGQPWTHLLPPGFPGSIGAKRLQPYAARSKIEKAKELAAGHFGDGKIIVVYQSYSTATRGQREVVRRDLIRLGFDPANIQMIPYSNLYFGFPEHWNIAVSFGWCPDFTDPYDFFRPLLDYEIYGNPLRGVLTHRYRERIERAERLVGNLRLKAFGKLDLDITKNLAPFVPMRTYNSRHLFSNRVDPRSLAYSGVYNDWSIPALALK
jgi:ABC-type oligopeptide transport system substrate-binding subunit